MTPGNESMIEATLPHEKTVHGYKVQKLPLGAYFNLIRKLDKIPKDFLSTAAAAWNENDDSGTTEAVSENNSRFLGVALNAISKFPDEALSIIADSCDISKEELEKDKNIGLDGFAELAVAVWEINELGKVFDKVKKKLPTKITGYLQNLLSTGKTGYTS